MPDATTTNPVTTTTTTTTSGADPALDVFEKIALGLLAAGEAAAPIFVHSPKGTVILNASEGLLTGILSIFGAK